MIVELCSCDWGLGVELPPHIHTVHQLLERIGDGEPHRFWAHGFLPQKGFRVIMEAPEIGFYVPRKELVRRS